MDWAWWLGAALLLVVIEMLSLDLVLIMFAAGALVAALLGALGAPLWLQILGFALTSTALLYALRPWVLRRLRDRLPLVETNAAAQVGRVAVVVAETSEHQGRVKLAGEVWSARTEQEVVLPVGTEVRVLRIDGATAVVTDREDDPRLPPAPRSTPPSHLTPDPGVQDYPQV